jgi:uroporphyrinogen-III synthase
MTTGALRVDQLAGFRVGVTSDRRADDLITALQRRGAQVLHAPALKIAPHEQDAALIQETRELITARPDVVMITTGYGMRRWLEVADATGLGAELTAVLDEATILARGPKAVGAIRAAGLEDARASGHVTTSSMIDDVIATGLAGRRVAIQVHGYTDEVQLNRLREVSASVQLVTPYRWVRPMAADRLPRLIDCACAGTVDAITFTSAPGAEATLATAAEMGRLTEFTDALRDKVLAAAVGPVTAGPLHEVGVEPATPDRYRLGALIRLVCDRLSTARVQRFRTGTVDLEVRGRAVTVGDRRVRLGPNALALLQALTSTPTVVSRPELLRCLPDAMDHHTLEVAMSRLRRALGVPDLIITVVKRGYRLNAIRLE